MTLESASSSRVVPTASRWVLIYRFALAGATLGFLVGVLEAGLLYFIPRATGLIRPDVSYVIWFLAPMVDLIAGALLGFVLGVLASLRKNSAVSAVIFAAIGVGLAGAYAAWLLDWFRIGVGVVFPRRLEAQTAVEAFVIVLIAALVLLSLLRRRSVSRPRRLSRHRSWLAFNLIVLAVLAGGVVFYATHRPFADAGRRSGARQAVFSPAAIQRPNVVLIVLDTVRADHLSCYGYSRPTTPDICALAARGVLFENAIAPSSWTLPSITSIFTGLMPHQTGADWGHPPDASPWELARILSSKGYETAGFNANPFYGLAGWRLAAGFEVYEDDSYALRHNLAVTFVGQSVVRYLYDHLIRYNQFDRRSAADVNRDVMHWARHRDPSQPYFLFINYMDAHRPYLPPPPFDRRFGRIPSSLLARVGEPLNNGRPRTPYSAEERTELVDGYDNSLAYLDGQVGRLINFIIRQPGGSQTIFIVTSDHGEGFGEHGAYDHGWNLYREVLHVPLIAAGTGIPSGIHVQAVVPSRQLFSTVLDLALGLKGPVERTSLRRYWEPSVEPSGLARAAVAASSPTASAMSDAAISELDIYSRGTDPASLSLTTPEWHFIVNSGGRAELFNVEKDPGEKNNLAADPARRETLATLRTALAARLAYSLLPWRATTYLTPLDQPGGTFIEQISSEHSSLPTAGILIGIAQAIFSHQPPSQLIHPTPAQQETLRTLPYH